MKPRRVATVVLRVDDLLVLLQGRGWRTGTATELGLAAPRLTAKRVDEVAGRCWRTLRARHARRGSLA